MANSNYPRLATTQLDLFSAMQRRERGQQRAIDHAQDAYKEAVWRAVEALAATGREFTADDVVERVGAPPLGFSSNIRGAVFSAAAKQGLIRFCGYTKSAQPLGHQNLLRKWVAA